MSNWMTKQQTALALYKITILSESAFMFTSYISLVDLI